MAESTTDYKKFKLLGGNRRIDRAHANNIGRSMALYPEIFKIRPILVNDRFEIIDGQHRYYAAKELGVPVWYEKGGDIKTEDAVVINQNQRNWQAMDYARSYAARGNEDYKAILRIKDEHPLIPLYALMRYMGGPAGNLAETFRQGKFKIVTGIIGETYLEQLEELVEIDRRFGLKAPANAMFRVFQYDWFDLDRLIHKLKTAPEGTLQLYGRHEDILRSLEEVYNWKQQKDIRRFF